MSNGTRVVPAFLGGRIEAEEWPADDVGAFTQTVDHLRLRGWTFEKANDGSIHLFSPQLGYAFRSPHVARDAPLRVILEDIVHRAWERQRYAETGVRPSD